MDGNATHQQQYNEERNQRWQDGRENEEPTVRKACQLLANAFNSRAGYRRYDCDWFETIDCDNVDSKWIRGVSDYIINIPGHGGLYAEIKYKSKPFYMTSRGGTTPNGSEIPNYGCVSFYLDVNPVYSHILQFASAFKINSQSFIFLFAETNNNNNLEIYVISLAEVTDLIQNGYNGIQLCIYGEGYGTINEDGQPAECYLIPKDATHHLEPTIQEYFQNRFSNKIMFPVNIIAQDNAFHYEEPTANNNQNNITNNTPRYAGNTNCLIYHCPNCQYLPNTSERIVLFSSRQEAINAGYRPCFTCRPDLDT